MERRRILKRLYGEPPTFDPTQVEELLRSVEMPKKFEVLKEKTIELGEGESLANVYMNGDTPYYEISWYVGVPDLYDDWVSWLADENGTKLTNKIQQIEEVFFQGSEVLYKRHIEDFYQIRRVGSDEPFGRVFTDEVYSYETSAGRFLVVSDESGEQFLIAPTGKIIARFVRQIWNVYTVGDKVFFLLTAADSLVDIEENNVHEMLIDQDGEVVGLSDEQFTPREIGDRLIYCDRVGDKFAWHNEKGEAIGGLFDSVGDPILHDDAFYFSASEKGKVFCVGPDGPYFGPNGEPITAPRSVNGELYHFIKIDDWWRLMKPDGSIVGEELVMHLGSAVVGDELYFIAPPVNEDREIYLFNSNGERLLKTEAEPIAVADTLFLEEHDRLSDARGNKLFSFDYLAERLEIEGRAYFISTELSNGVKLSYQIHDQNGRQIGESYDHVEKDPIVAGGEVFFRVLQEGMYGILDQNGILIGGWMDRIIEHKIVNDQLFIVGDKGERFLMNRSGQKIGKEDDAKYRCFETNDGPVLFAAKYFVGGNLYDADGNILQTQIIEPRLAHGEIFFDQQNSKGFYELYNIEGDVLPTPLYTGPPIVSELSEKRILVVGTIKDKQNPEREKIHQMTLEVL